MTERRSRFGKASPASSPRPRLSATARRERILAAATTVIGANGYADASIAEIARTAGVTPPVLYDHFPSKLALYEAVVDRHFARLRAIWGQFPRRELSEESVAASFYAWFGYVEQHPDAARILFREPTGADAAAVHRAVSDRSRDLVLQLLTSSPRGASLTASKVDREMIWVAMRGVLQGLALWWVDHPKASRDRVVAVAFASLWSGYGVLLKE